jgi:predicted transcriptional regulator
MYTAFIFVLFIITFAIIKIAKNSPTNGTISPIIRNNPFLSYVEFALENNWIIKQEDGSYKLTDYGKEFVNEFRSS